MIENLEFRPVHPSIGYLFNSSFFTPDYRDDF
jgi:hypothetical protein